MSLSLRNNKASSMNSLLSSEISEFSVLESVAQHRAACHIPTPVSEFGYIRTLSRRVRWDFLSQYNDPIQSMEVKVKFFPLFFVCVPSIKASFLGSCQHGCCIIVSSAG